MCDARIFDEDYFDWTFHLDKTHSAHAHVLSSTVAVAVFIFAIATDYAVAPFFLQDHVPVIFIQGFTVISLSLADAMTNTFAEFLMQTMCNS